MIVNAFTILDIYTGISYVHDIQYQPADPAEVQRLAYDNVTLDNGEN